jgi:hypothetical protein
MSEDKKPKIDLKARLGKKTVSTPAAGPGGSIPPPAGIPKPSGVSAPIPSGIPAPPFQSPTTSVRPAAPVVDATNPYGAMAPAAAPVVAQPAAIRIELSDDVVAAQKGGRTKVLMLALVTCVLGVGIGFTLGGASERGKGTEAAVQGAKDLTKDIEAANAKIEELANVLKSAKEKLGKAQFPEEEVSKLGALNIPFNGTNLSGKGIGRFKSDVLNGLVTFATATAEANDQKEKIQSVLSRNKKGVQEFLDGQKNPVIRWSVMVSGSPFGPIASMQPLPTPFPVQSPEKKAWPESFELMADKKKVTIKRYTKGEAATEDPTFIPVDPGTQNLVCPNDVLFSIRRELSGMEEVLRGNPTPGEEKVGLLEQGQTLVKKLKQIGAAPQ